MFAISISMADFWQKMAVYRLDCWYKKKKKKFFTEKNEEYGKQNACKFYQKDLYDSIRGR